MSAPGRELIGGAKTLAVGRFLSRLMQGTGLGRVRGARALDLGCGDGLEAAYLAGLGYQVDAFDLEAHPDWAALAARHKGRLRFGIADAARATMGRRRYDLVFQKDMLHHARDPLAVLVAMRQKLRPGGRLLALECNRANPISYVHLTLLGGHQHFTAGQLGALADAAGLQGHRISRREARVWPVESAAFQGFIDRVQDLVEALPGLRSIAVYNILSWVGKAR